MARFDDSDYAQSLNWRGRAGNEDRKEWTAEGEAREQIDLPSWRGKSFESGERRDSSHHHAKSHAILPQPPLR